MDFSIIQTIFNMIKPFVEVLILAYLIYYFNLAVANTKAEQIPRIILSYLFTYMVFFLLKLETLVKIYEYSIIIVVIFLIIIYQSELRHSFTGFWTSRKLLFKIDTYNLGHQIDTILSAAKELSQMRKGALIVLQRNLSLKSVIESGTRLNADLSKNIIMTIFAFQTALHDGAMIISRNKIIAAGCFLPLTERTNIKKSFGTRHRAAVGLSEESDAIIIVVSEETGAITLCYSNNFYYDLAKDEIKDRILEIYNDREVKGDE